MIDRKIACLPGALARTRSLWLPAALLCGLALGLGGCASLSEPPRVNLVNIRPTAISLLEQRYLITLRIQNPNRAPLAIEGLDYRIRINGKSFADGVSSQHVTIDGYSEKILDLGVRSTLLQVFDQLKALAENRGHIGYSIEGHLRLRDYSFEVPFKHQGDVDLRLRPQPKKYTAQRTPSPYTTL